jgi:hypothetical protein
MITREGWFETGLRQVPLVARTVKYQVPRASGGVLNVNPVMMALCVGALGSVPHRTSYCVTHGVALDAQETRTDAARSELQVATTVPGAVTVVARAVPVPAADEDQDAPAGTVSHTMADSPSTMAAMRRMADLLASV